MRSSSTKPRRLSSDSIQTNGGPFKRGDVEFLITPYFPFVRYVNNYFILRSIPDLRNSALEREIINNINIKLF